MSKIVIVGPTASGKTELSIRLAKEFNGECVNYDSTQLFKNVDIATNKVTKEEEDGVIHHLLSIVDVNDNIDVVTYRNMARQTIDSIVSKKNIPILVGGTGFYLLATIKNYSFFGKKRENEIIIDSQEIEKLKKDDSLIKGVDSKRLLRKKQLLSELDINSLNLEKEETYFYDDLIIIGLNPNRETLYNKLNDRVIDQLDRGLLEEVKELYKECNYDRKKQVLNCICVKELIMYIEDEISYESAIKMIQKSNRNYAKRQMTYFKNKFEDNIAWFNHNFSDFNTVVDDIVEYVEKKLTVLNN